MTIELLANDVSVINLACKAVNVNQFFRYESLFVNCNCNEALVLRPLLEDRGCITESMRILVPVDRMKQKCFQITTKQVRRSQQFQLRNDPGKQHNITFV